MIITQKNIKLSFLFLFVLITYGCRTPFQFINYTLWNTPRYYAQTVQDEHVNFDGNLKIVSYNIKHSRKIKQAIDLLRNNEYTADADVILLQEMTPAAIEKISQALGYNYIFYPAVVHPFLKTDFGNAVLSKWPIVDDENIIFPPIKEKRRHRVAVSARININGLDVLFYSIHMGVFMKPYQRSRQIQGILDLIPSDVSHVILGGDFNTFTEKNKTEVIHTFTTYGFQHGTPEVDWTFKHWYILNQPVVLDHIFYKGFRKTASGKISDPHPSDHLPVWAEFEL